MAFLSAIALALREARRVGEDPNKILDLCFYALVAAIVGSRILYVLVNWSVFRHDPLEILRIWHGGLVFYGGFVGAVVTAVWYITRHGLPFLKTLDIMGPSIAFGQFVGRIGCFFAGCCYGKACDLPYSSLNGLLIFLMLVGLKRIKRFEGQIFWTYVLLYGVTRFALEYFREDERGMFMQGMFSTSQLFGLIMVVIAIAIIIILRRRSV
jgi:phosphatidylglycerol:prolipoprotein diacylglycerol transferase